MAVNPDEDTEFNDALRKHGILPARPTPPRTPSPPPSPTLDELLEDYTPKDIQELADNAHDDETERVLDNYRRKRLAELRQDQFRTRFGRVYPIGREDYKREVTEASAVDEDDPDMKGKGTGVVCFLYKDGHLPSERAFEHVRKLSAQYPQTKFVSIVGDKCIPDYPDRHLPTLFIYRKGEIANQQVAWGATKERTIDDLRTLLIQSGAVVPLNRRAPTNTRGRGDDDDCDEDAKKNIRDADGDSDLELDL